MKRNENVMKISKIQLDEKVNYIERMGQVKLYLKSENHHSTYHYQLIEIFPDDSEHPVNDGILNATEMYYYLLGIVDGVAAFATWRT